MPNGMKWRLTAVGIGMKWGMEYGLKQDMEWKIEQDEN